MILNKDKLKLNHFYKLFNKIKKKTYIGQFTSDRLGYITFSVYHQEDYKEIRLMFNSINHNINLDNLWEIKPFKKETKSLLKKFQQLHESIGFLNNYKLPEYNFSDIPNDDIFDYILNDDNTINYELTKELFILGIINNERKRIMDKINLMN